jgi:hypothetical protein
MNISKNITKATIKSFLNKSKELFIIEESCFDGMVDCVMPSDNKLKSATKEQITRATAVEYAKSNFNQIEFNNYVGYEIYNCCGSWKVLTNKI